MLIQEILSRRTDLSTFLVHLTRSFDGVSARDRLCSILLSNFIEARSPFGHGVSQLSRAKLNLRNQYCVCFTETPLQHISLMTQEIQGRRIRLAPYGVAITKVQGRRYGLNPVWYLDITPGHDWLTTPVNSLVERAINEGRMDDDVFALTPFIEQFGFGSGRLKDFSWEREWRVRNGFPLPGTYVVVCPESEHTYFRNVMDAAGNENHISFIDANWSLEEIIARLAGLGKDDIGIVSSN